MLLSQLLDNTESKYAFPNPLELKSCKMSRLLPTHLQPPPFFCILLGCHVCKKNFAYRLPNNKSARSREKPQVKKVGSVFGIKRKMRTNAWGGRRDEQTASGISFCLGEGEYPRTAYSYFFSCVLNWERLKIKTTGKMPAFESVDGRGVADGMLMAMSFGRPLASIRLSTARQDACQNYKKKEVLPQERRAISPLYPV
jgi:hypothetical protein